VNAADCDMLVALADLAASYLDLPRPAIVPLPGGAVTVEEHTAWLSAYKKNDAAYESLVQRRSMRVEVALRHLASNRFAETSIKSITESLAEELAEPLPYPVAPETQS
jgi:hypothetical protein